MTRKTLKVRRVPITWGWRPWEGNRHIDTIIVHTMYNPSFSDEARFAEKNLLDVLSRYGVAPHCLILRDGEQVQLVADNDVAFHAGESALPEEPTRTNVNIFSLGVELPNAEDTVPTDEQYSSLAMYIREKMQLYPIRHVRGHGEVALPRGRKIDPINLDKAKLWRIMQQQEDSGR